jgi:hypothetical protein
MVVPKDAEKLAIDSGTPKRAFALQYLKEYWPHWNDW